MGLLVKNLLEWITSHCKKRAECCREPHQSLCCFVIALSITRRRLAYKKSNLFTRYEDYLRAICWLNNVLAFVLLGPFLLAFNAPIVRSVQRVESKASLVGRVQWRCVIRDRWMNPRPWKHAAFIDETMRTLYENNVYKHGLLLAIQVYGERT